MLISISNFASFSLYINMVNPSGADHSRFVSSSSSWNVFLWSLLCCSWAIGNLFCNCRLTNSLMMHGRNNGKKLMAVRIVKHAMEIIHLLTDQNPIQVIVDAIINRYLLIFRSCTHVWRFCWCVLNYTNDSFFYSLMMNLCTFSVSKNLKTTQESEVVLLNRLLEWQQCVVVLVCLELT